MQLTFLGTGAGIPAKERNVSALVLTFLNRNQSWLFDCGEGTQHQFIRSGLKSSKIEKIFITHLHGDHLFGLPGLLTSRSMSGLSQPLTLYGPKGIREYIAVSLSLSASRLCFSLEIIELTPGLCIQAENTHLTVLPLNHIIPCFGFRINYQQKPPSLLPEMLKQDKIPAGPWLATLKLGSSVCLPDGRVLEPSRYLAQRGEQKILTILGDTAPCENAKILAQGADLLVHETTLEKRLAEKANSRGHSSTEQAAITAKAAGVKRLIATHISARYGRDQCRQLLAECQEIFPATELAQDFSSFTV